MLSKHLGQLTHLHFGVRLWTTAFRKFASFWLKEHISPVLQHTYDIINKWPAIAKKLLSAIITRTGEEGGSRWNCCQRRAFNTPRLL
jgi:hypothetical protein